MIKSHEDLCAWQKGYQLTKSVYKLTQFFPKEERYCFVDQMRRAALSVPSNIAEGFYRGSRAEYRRFCLISYGSANELQTQMKLAKDLNFAPSVFFEEVDALLSEVLKLLNALCGSLKS